MTTANKIEAALREACLRAGLNSNDAQPIRIGENAIFRLPDRVIARISRPGQQRAAQREVAVSRWLNESGIKTVATLTEVTQPITVHERSVTFWEELPVHRKGTPSQVAVVLKRLHALPVPDDLPLGVLDPFVRLRQRIDAATTIAIDDHGLLNDTLDALRTKWENLRPILSTCVIHGDAWAGNIASTDDGQIILLDLERCSIGPREWDLTSTAVKHVTYGMLDRDQYQQFCDAYGLDVTASNGFELLRDIRELRMTCYVAQQAAEHQEFQQEANLRIDCLRGKHGRRPWPWTPAE